MVISPLRRLFHAINALFLRVVLADEFAFSIDFLTNIIIIKDKITNYIGELHLLYWMYSNRQLHRQRSELLLASGLRPMA